MKTNKHIIASFLLVLFSFIQIIDLHELSHDQDHTECKICQLASDTLSNSFISESNISVPEILIFPSNHIFGNYTTRSIPTVENSSSLNKAPPIA